MSAIQKKKGEKAIPVRIDTRLDKYDDVVLFPEKLAQANEHLKKSPFPGFPTKKK